MTTEQVLREARRLIVEVGWTQFHFSARDKSGCVIGYCAAGALVKASGPMIVSGIDPYGEALSFMEAVIGIDSLSNWNDDPARTKAEVVAAFDRALEGMR